MQIANTFKELREIVGYDGAYDIDTHMVIENASGYKFPVLVEFCGTTHLGDAYRLLSKEEALENYNQLLTFLGKSVV